MDGQAASRSAPHLESALDDFFDVDEEGGDEAAGGNGEEDPEDAEMLAAVRGVHQRLPCSVGMEGGWSHPVAHRSSLCVFPQVSETLHHSNITIAGNTPHWLLHGIIDNLVDRQVRQSRQVAASPDATKSRAEDLSGWWCGVTG